MSWVEIREHVNGESEVGPPDVEESRTQYAHGATEGDRVTAHSGAKNDRTVSNLANIAPGQSSSLFRNGAYNLGGQALRGVVTLLAIPCLIRVMGVREYGVWSLAYAVLALITMSEAGISVAVTVFLSKDHFEGDPQEASRTLTFILVSTLLLSLALGLFLWYAGPLIVPLLSAFNSSERSEAARALQIAGLVVSVVIFQRMLVGVEQAFDRYAIINALDLCQSLLLSVGIVVVAFSGGRTVAMMKWQVLVSTAIGASHSYVVYRLLRGRGITWDWSRNKARRIFHYSLATWAATLGTAAFSQCDRLIVGVVLGAPALGIYSAITGISSKINSFSGTAVQPLIPALSRDTAWSSFAEARIREAVQINALIAIQAGMALYLLADWIMRVMLPNITTRQEILGLQIAAVIYVLYSLNALGFYILFALHDTRTNAIVTLSSSAFSLFFIFLGAKYFGLLGAVAGNAGYLGTVFLTTAGLKKAKIALRCYLRWMGFPLLALTGILLVGKLLEDRFWWRAGFLASQAVLFFLWFVREQPTLALAKVRAGASLSKLSTNTN